MDHRASLPIQRLCDRFYRESLGCQFGSPVYGHQTRNTRLYDEPVNHLSSHNFDTGKNLFLMPSLAACANSGHDNQSDRHATPSCLGRWNIQNFFAKLIDILYSKKHIFLPYSASDKLQFHRFHKRIIHALCVVGDLFLLACFLSAKTFRIAYCNMRSLIARLVPLDAQRFYHTKSKELSVLGIVLCPCRKDCKTFGLGVFLVAESCFYNIHKVSYCQ